MGERGEALVFCPVFSLYLSVIICCHVFASSSYYLGVVALSRPSSCCCNMMAGEGNLLSISPLFETSLFFPLSKVAGCLDSEYSLAGWRGGGKEESSAEAECGCGWKTCACSCPEVLMNVLHKAHVT